jgi:hypothetical protein
MEPKVFSLRSVRLLYKRVVTEKQNRTERQQSDNNSDNQEVGQFSTSQYEVVSEVNELVKK